MGIAPRSAMFVPASMSFLRLKRQRKLFFVCLLLASALSSSNGRAQSAPPKAVAPPSAPYVGTLKGNFKFIKTYAYKPQPPPPAPIPGAPPPEPPPPRLQELNSIQYNGIRKDLQSFVDGAKTEVWRSGPYRFLIYSFKPDYILGATVSPTGYEDDPDFKELDWINATDFAGEQVLQEKKCYVYKVGGQTAWIDESTLLPLFYDSGLIKITYAYPPIGDETLQMPERISKRLQELKRAWSGR